MLFVYTLYVSFKITAIIYNNGAWPMMNLAHEMKQHSKTHKPLSNAWGDNTLKRKLGNRLLILQAIEQLTKDNGEDPRVACVVEYTGIGQSGAYSITGLLIETGYLISQQDGQAKHLKLTDLGLEAIEKGEL